ncbi:glycosyltransferase [Curtobacterium sp. MCPF17_031]|uniref:glycosyltransferase n=1 Tax=Curtobacterium sp. MCPF17_031 TaxID=2175653 RepID=UPI000DA7E230|nr:glycosyltransferase [Curtobacterium sp. MCPF17_031]PZE38658.1 hypothetical protein DEJ31_05135 [Curtobacterium sp. MCPF17_031]
MISLTVVTVSHESSQVLQGFLERLGHGRGPMDSVVVVDSGSLDAERSRAVAERFDADFRRVPVNVGFGTASNIGASAVDTDFLAFVNPDVETTFEDLHALAVEGDRVGAACVGPRVRDSRGNYARAERGTIASPLARRRDVDASGEQPVESIAGCCMVLPTKWFQAAGGFDPFFFMFTEEIDLHRRITRAGGLIGVVDSVTVVTEGGGSSSEVGSRWSVTEREVAHVRFTWKWYGLPAAALDFLWRIVLIVRKPAYRPTRVSLAQFFRGVLSRAGRQRRVITREYGALPWD